MPNLQLVKTNSTKQKLPKKQEEIDMMIERIDSVVNWMIEYDNDECSYNWLLTGALTDLVKAKSLLLAWNDEEY